MKRFMEMEVVFVVLLVLFVELLDFLLHEVPLDDEHERPSELEIVDGEEVLWNHIVLDLFLSDLERLDDRVQNLQHLLNMVKVDRKVSLQQEQIVVDFLHHIVLV